MSQSENTNTRVYTIDLIYKIYKEPTTNHYKDYGATVRNPPINIPDQQSFLNNFINKNTQLLQEFSNRGIGLLYLKDNLPPISIKNIKTRKTVIRNGNELLVTIEFQADNGLQELMDDQSTTAPGQVDDTSSFYYQGPWWYDLFEKDIDEITEEDKIRYIFEFLFFDDVEVFDNVLDTFGVDFFIDHNDEKHYFTGEVQNVKSELLKDLKEAEVELIKTVKNILENKIGHVGSTKDIVDFVTLRYLTKEEAVKAFQKGGKKSKTNKTNKTKKNTKSSKNTKTSKSSKGTKGTTNKTKKKNRRNTV